MKRVINPCTNCGRSKGEHNAKTGECPFGRKHGVLGYTSFGPTRYEPKPAKQPK